MSASVIPAIMPVARSTKNQQRQNAIVSVPLCWILKVWRKDLILKSWEFPYSVLDISWCSGRERTLLEKVFRRRIHWFIGLFLHVSLPWWLRQYSICLQWGRPGFNPWVGKIPWRRKWHPTPVLLPGKSHGQKILVGYGPWGRKESDSAAWLHFLSAKTVCLICFFWQCSLLVVSWLAILVIWFQFKCYLLREAFPDHTVS